MKYIQLISLWAFKIIFLSASMSAAIIQADPSDDFSFSLVGHYQGREIYHLMPIDKVESVLKDRLDLFPKSQARKLAQHLVELCQKNRLNPAFILSLMQVESSYRVKATSHVGALGLMQVMLPTAQFIVQNLKIYSTHFEPFYLKDINKKKITSAMVLDPYFNITLGVTYIAWLRDYYQGFSPYHIVAAYNVGPARMDYLIAQKSFEPTATKKYFHSIRKGIPHLRTYQAKI